MLIRVLASFLLLFSILFMPFWVSILLALAGMIYFDLYWEAVLLFFLSDLLYGTSEVKLHGLTFISFLLSMIILITIELLKKKLKFYNKNIK